MARVLSQMSCRMSRHFRLSDTAAAINSLSRAPRAPIWKLMSSLRCVPRQMSRAMSRDFSRFSRCRGSSRWDEFFVRARRFFCASTTPTWQISRHYPVSAACQMSRRMSSNLSRSQRITGPGRARRRSRSDCTTAACSVFTG